MTENSSHNLRLQVFRSGALVRLVSRSPGLVEGAQLESYRVIVNFDASSGLLSAWRTTSEDGKIDSLVSYGRSATGPLFLSARESEVVGHLALGEADKEIARLMAISVGTVKVHVKTVIRKLGVANRTQAAILVLSNRGLLNGSFKIHPELPNDSPGR